ncbi:site-2 protease family protein [Patescibacteria group bacterium]
MHIKFSEEELIHLLYAWAAISFAFAVVLGGGLVGQGTDFVQNFLVAAIAVGTGFLFHELAHKIMAQRYGCWAEFRKFNFGLILAVSMSFFGFIFAAPGAVMISGLISKEQNGKISAIGPLTNIIVAILFFTLGTILFSTIGQVGSFLGKIISYGFFINAWLALFNLIPFPPFDGSKIITWSVPTWIALVVVAGYMVFFL